MADIDVEVAFALPDRQWLRSLRVPTGKTVGEVIGECGLSAAFPDIDFSGYASGVWGRETGKSTVLRDGDRVEVYRPLDLDPREARRQLALVGLTMSGSGPDESSD